MSLYRQIVAMTLVFFSLLLALVYSVEFNNTRAYLSRQLASDVQNTVTTLGLSLVPYLQSGDRVAVESVVNTVFDGGYYKSIEVDLLASEQQVVRLQSSQIEGVPAWFTELQLFDPVEEQQVLTSGWLQLGALRVSGHTGYAYQQLWQLMTQMLLWFMLVYVLVSTLLVLGLGRVLKPLKLLEHRSQEIENQQFGQPLPEPAIRELQGLVRAFNRMSQRLKAIFKQQAEEVEELRRQAFQDVLTGLGNRAFFDAQLAQWLAEPGSGAVMLLAIPNLEQVYRDEGHRGRDELLCVVREILCAQLAHSPGAVIARISANEFGVILPGVDAEQSRQLAAQLVHQTELAVVDPFGHYRQLCRLGVAVRQADATPSLLLSQADLALQQASRDPAQCFRVHRPDNRQLVLGREGWKLLVENAMAHDGVRFQLQAVPAVADGQPLYHELFACIEKDAIRYAAGQFMPFVEQFGISAKFDRFVLSRLRSLKPGLGQPLMVNLSAASIADADFVHWLKDYLQTAATEGLELVIEIPEEAAVRHAESLQELLSHCRKLGIPYGIDRFGYHFDILAELAALKPTYLKMDIAYLITEGVDADFAQSLAKLSAAQQIEIIACRVETDQQLQSLKSLPVSAYQGFIVPPVMLPQR